MKTNLLKPTGGSTLGLVCGSSSRMILPQETALWRRALGRFEAAVSNDIFVANYHAVRLNDLTVIQPDGDKSEAENLHTGKYRTVFDVKLEDEGTYKVFTASNGMRAMWEEDGKRRMYPGRGEQYTEEGFAENVPEKADKLRVMQSSRRMETFVTLGAPTSDDLSQPIKDWNWFQWHRTISILVSRRQVSD